MKKWSVRALALLMTLGWSVQVIAQCTGNDPTDTKHHGQSTVEQPVEVDRATLPKKLLWAGIALINPNDHYELTPLFSYSISALGPDVVENALAEANASNVRIAILRHREMASGSEDEDIYEGWGVQVPNNSDNFVFPNDWCDFWGNDLANGMIAFTRPLRGTTPEEEFVAGSNLWAN